MADPTLSQEIAPTDDPSAILGEGFYAQIMDLSTFKTLARTLPWLSREQGKEIGVMVISSGDGVMVNLTLPDGSADADVMRLAETFPERLRITERLVEIELLVAEFQRVGVNPDEVDKLIQEGNALVQKLHPKDAPSSRV